MIADAPKQGGVATKADVLKIGIVIAVALANVGLAFAILQLPGDA